MELDVVVADITQQLEMFEDVGDNDV